MMNKQLKGCDSIRLYFEIILFMNKNIIRIENINSTEQ